MTDEKIKEKTIPNYLHLRREAPCFDNGFKKPPSTTNKIFNAIFLSAEKTGITFSPLAIARQAASLPEDKDFGNVIAETETAYLQCTRSSVPAGSVVGFGFPISPSQAFRHNHDNALIKASKIFDYKNGNSLGISGAVNINPDDQIFSNLNATGRDISASINIEFRH